MRLVGSTDQVIAAVEEAAREGRRLVVTVSASRTLLEMGRSEIIDLAMRELADCNIARC